MKETLSKKYYKDTSLFLFLLLLLTFVQHGFAQKREIALTIDDLPFVGESRNFHLDKIIGALQESQIPTTGFVIANEISAQNWPVLEKFRDAGFGLGNHTMTHANLNTMKLEAYIKEIEAADKILARVLTEPKFFRYPYMAVGKGNKKERVEQYLLSKNYHIAPITIDSKDFIFNQLLLSVSQNERRYFLNVLRPCYVDFIWQQTLKAEENNRLAHKPDQPQILLIHANLLNAYVLPDIIKLYKDNGYTFISLKKALKSKQAKGTRQSPRQKFLISKQESAVENYVDWD